MKSSFVCVLGCVAFLACGAPVESIETTPVEAVVEAKPPFTPTVPPEKSCEAVLPEQALGSLALQEGFELVSSAFIPESMLAITAVGDTFFGLNEKLFTLHRLGKWPQLCNEGRPVVSVIPLDVLTTKTFLNGYLETDGTHLLTGYTLSDAGAPGKVLLYNTQTETPRFFSAPGNYTAIGVSGGFLINGVGLESLSGKAGIFGLSTLPSAYQASVVATFDETWAAASGFSAITEDGIAVLGHFNGKDFQNYLHAVPQALHQGALQAQTPFKLAEQSQVFVGSDLFRIAGFGKGVALHQGSYDMETWEPQTREISFLPLSVEA